VDVDVVVVVVVVGGGGVVEATSTALTFVTFLTFFAVFLLPLSAAVSPAWRARVAAAAATAGEAPPELWPGAGPATVPCVEASGLLVVCGGGLER
jgi:hypothetical protein